MGRVVAALCVVWIGLVAGAAAAADAPRLLDPSNGETVAVEPGGRALHLVFFATWCPTCVAELPRLAELEARWGELGYRLVLIGVHTRQTTDRLAEFAREERPPGRLLYDADGAAAEAWKARRLPTHVVIAPDGTEVARSATLDETIEQAVAGLVDDRRRGGRRR